MLTDKAYNYIKYSLNILRVHLNNLSKWTFSNRESIFIYIRRYYKTIIRNKGNWPLYKASCLNVRQVAVTCRRGTSVVRNLKFLTPFFSS